MHACKPIRADAACMIVLQPKKTNIHTDRVHWVKGILSGLFGWPCRGRFHSVLCPAQLAGWGPRGHCWCRFHHGSCCWHCTHANRFQLVPIHISLQVLKHAVPSPKLIACCHNDASYFCLGNTNQTSTSDQHRAEQLGAV